MLKQFAFPLAASLGMASAIAQTAPDIQANPNSAYVQDSRGIITRTPFGLCWRTGYWTPADAVAGCDGELLPPVAKPIAPTIAAPAPIASPPLTAPKRCDFEVTLSNDQTFTFNKALLSRAAKARIDNEVLGQLENCTTIETIQITGHTDPLGSQQYNQKLSEKRADAVASYLKNKGVKADINTLGAGKTQPIKTCNTKLPRKQLLECLAPNRRVIIEARGIAK